MGGMFMAGIAGMFGEEIGRRQHQRLQEQQQQQAAALGTGVAEAREELRDLREHIGRMALMNQALWELLRDKLGVSDDELAKKAEDIDLRDGVADGKMTATAVRCPKCGRVSNSRHSKCLYCGARFDKPVMG